MKWLFGSTSLYRVGFAPICTPSLGAHRLEMLVAGRTTLFFCVYLFVCGATHTKERCKPLLMRSYTLNMYSNCVRAKRWVCLRSHNGGSELPLGCVGFTDDDLMLLRTPLVGFGWRQHYRSRCTYTKFDIGTKSRHTRHRSGEQQNRSFFQLCTSSES